jgi:hypothetical protein
MGEWRYSFILRSVLKHSYMLYTKYIYKIHCIINCNVLAFHLLVKNAVILLKLNLYKPVYDFHLNSVIKTVPLETKNLPLCR